MFEVWKEYSNDSDTLAMLMATTWNKKPILDSNSELDQLTDCIY